MRRLALIAAGLLVALVLVLSQLLLPGIAEQRLRDQLARSGDVLSVEVHAFPALELLWHHADRVRVRMGRYRSGTSKLGSLVAQAGGVAQLDASARELDAGLLTLHNATLRKRGASLTADADVSDAELRAALPLLTSVTPVASPAGTLTLQGTATLFGVTATAAATLSTAGGALVLTPDVPFGGLATITVFANPHVAVESVSAVPQAGGLRLHARATLR